MGATPTMRSIPDHCARAFSGIQAFEALSHLRFAASIFFSGARVQASAGVKLLAE